jgi:hypothetical protein
MGISALEAAIVVFNSFQIGYCGQEFLPGLFKK